MQIRRLGSVVTARWGGSRRFWRTRSYVSRVWARITRAAFRVRSRGDETRTTISAARTLAVYTCLPVLLAVAAVVALHFLEKAWPGFIESLGLKHSTAGRAITHEIDGGAYSVLLQSVAAVTGVFLALYFTAVSTVAAMVYAEVPHDIRDLMLRDKLGNAYVSVVAFVSALAVFLLVAQAAGDAPYHLALPVVGVLAGFSIFAFIRLGQRAFYFADPTVLADTVAIDFARAFANTTPTGVRWRDPAFQDMYRRKARRSLGALDVLMALSRNREHLRGDPQRRLVSRALTLLETYLRAKSRVPTKSRWFGERFQHKQWYLTDSAELDMATQTSTQLSPTSIPDLEWVETALLEPVLETLREDLRQGEVADAYAALDSFPPAWLAFGTQLDADKGMQWANRVADLILDCATGDSAPDAKARSATYLLAATDMAAFLPMSVELGLYSRLARLDVARLRSGLVGADWSSADTPYAFALPRAVVETLEDLHSGVEFEIAADSLVRTPGWYIAEIALNRLGWIAHEQVEACVANIESWYPVTADRLVAAGQYKSAAAVLSRGLEQAWKLGQHLEGFENVAARLAENAVIEDLSRPSWDWSSLRARVARLRRENLTRMASLIPRLAIEDDSQDVPDYFGHAVHVSGEACFAALLDNDAELFGELIGAYFVGVPIIVNRLRSQVAGWSSTRSAVTWMSEPVMDLIDLSGYALIFSEYHGNPNLWESCRVLWETYLDGPGGSDSLAWVSAVSGHHQHLFAITPRSLLRTQREMALSRLLVELPRGPRLNVFTEGGAVHPSALIRRIAPTSGIGTGYFDAQDVFVARFLMQHANAAGLDFGISADKVTALTDLDGTSADAEEDG